MTNNAHRRRVTGPFGAAVAVVLAVAGSAGFEAAAQQGAPAAGSPRSAAPIDLTGYWVSVVNEDWRYRMVTPQKGDYQSVPLNDEGQRVADAWDLAADDAAGVQCKPFGIGNIMRQPGRLHITWQDEGTLRIDADAGTQTRLLYFGEVPPPPGEKTWQGHSIATWEGPAFRGRGGRGRGRGRGGPPPEGGSLRVVTTNFREGYLRTNGVPYSEEASVIEYFDRLPVQANGDVWLMVVTTVEDPKYLDQPFLTSTHFKLEPDGSKWNPTPCSTDPPGAVTLNR